MTRHRFWRTCIISILSVLTVSFSIGACAQDASGAYGTFQPDLVIPDEYVVSGSPLTSRDIQTFLQQRNSALATMSFFTPSGWLSTSEIIAQASQSTGISAQFLLVKLQKEQGLIEATNPTQKALDWATGYGICDSCSLSDPSLLPFKGFYNQVTYAAKQMRKYLDYPSRYHFQAGQITTVDGQSFVIRNSVTAALYNYTPHINGNRNIWLLWQRYWYRSFADGVVLAATNPADPTQVSYWLIKNGKRLRFASKGVFLSYQDAGAVSGNIKTVPETELARYPIGNDIRFQEYTIIQGPGGTRYMVRDGQRLAFDSNETFKLAGFNPEEVELVTSDDIDTLPLGKMITKKDLYPVGTVVREIDSGKYFYLEQNVRYPIPTKDILSALYPGRKEVKMSKKQLDKTELGASKFYPAGTVIKGDRKKDVGVFLVTDKGLKPFTTALDFKQLGYVFKDVKVVSYKLLQQQKVLDPVETGIDVTAPTPDISGTVQTSAVK